MRIAIVGSGPSAEGHAAEIDGCDYVVRIKAWWKTAAPNAGKRIDAWVIYAGPTYAPVELVERPSVIWRARCDKQYEASVRGEVLRRSVQTVAERLGCEVVRLSTSTWGRACKAIGRHPSTGFLAVCMAVEQFPGSQLVLFGFDSTTPDKPRFYSCFASESEKERTRHHDFLKEKQLIRRLTAAEWLGEPANNRLEWVDAPLLPDMAGMR